MRIPYPGPCRPAKQLEISTDIDKTRRSFEILMKIRGMPRDTLASFAHCSRQTVDRFLDGFTRPTSTTLAGLSRALGITLSDGPDWAVAQLMTNINRTADKEPTR